MEVRYHDGWYRGCVVTFDAAARTLTAAFDDGEAVPHIPFYDPELRWLDEIAPAPAPAAAACAGGVCDAQQAPVLGLPCGAAPRPVQPLIVLQFFAINPFRVSAVCIVHS